MAFRAQGGPGILEDIVRRCEFLKPEAGLAARVAEMVVSMLGQCCRDGRVNPAGAIRTVSVAIPLSLPHSALNVMAREAVVEGLGSSSFAAPGATRRPLASHPSFARYYCFQELCNRIFNVFFFDVLSVHRLMPFCLVIEHDRKPGVRANYSQLQPR